ncbi:uncharacterized protein LY79DRAFT_522145 [Colletotrichum navitas]|uniref:Uncharacterized protein n=1 Tax=Colletotrichum navitas TaxID=681940 RepID=A0AAD8PS72_9PEZI|nr:uncharacterized protein LY79DRAFT_522145 [Colletotrichum navitas]KAK1579656.1 hypothetical protein LY79DRAFT_522145 [Colletotrichum navitas]
MPFAFSLLPESLFSSHRLNILSTQSTPFTSLRYPTHITNLLPSVQRLLALNRTLTNTNYQTPTHTSSKMSSRYSNAKPVVHQAPASINSGYSASSGSYGSSRSSSTVRSVSPSDEAYLRVYGAADHQSTMRHTSSGVTVINRRQTGYEAHAPSPTYTGSYARA